MSTYTLPGYDRWLDPPDDDEYEDDEGNLHPTAYCSRHRARYLADEECPQCDREIDAAEWDGR